MTPSTALVTGANKGIGREIARRLLATGCTVYIGSRDKRRGEAAAGELSAVGDARPLVIDVTDPGTVAAAAARIDRLDALINNAGISHPDGGLSSVDAAALRSTYETNVFGVVTVTNAFLPALRACSQPRIVNVSSGTGSLGWSIGPQRQFPAGISRYSVYRASKTALNAITVMYALELADAGFKVNSYAPGVRATDLNESARERGGDVAEAAVEAVRLASLPADGPTGTFVNWDGAPVPW